jgi:hypothetical protein
MTVDVNMMLPNDDDALFKTAAESSMDWFWLEEGTTNIVIVIKLDFLDGPYSAIRGAHGNGPYYLFMPIEKGFQLPGKMAGNGYHHGTLNGRAQFITSWHMGGGEAYENIYDWDGKTFKLTSRILYRYDFDGSRKIIKVSSTDPPIPRPARRVAAPHN